MKHFYNNSEEFFRAIKNKKWDLKNSVYSVYDGNYIYQYRIDREPSCICLFPFCCSIDLATAKLVKREPNNQREGYTN